MSVERSQYSGPQGVDPTVKESLPVRYIDRLQQEIPEGLYLLNPARPGPLFCAKRGKLLVVAAGNVSRFLSHF